MHIPASQKAGIAMRNTKTPHAAGLFLGAALALVLVACGGGGGSSSSPTAGSGNGGIPNTPATQRLETIAQHADSLLLPSQQVDVTIRAQGRSETQRLHEGFRCAGVRCEAERSGVFIDLDGVANIVLVPRNVRLDTRAGFDTTTYSVDALESVADLVNEFPGLRIDRLPSARAWGFWGEHGMGAVSAANGRFSGRFDGIAFSGTLASANALALGETTGTNPAGIGAAAWEGVAEAVSLRSYTRQQGTASVSIADLSNPRVSVDVQLSGRSIGSSAWNDMPLSAGEYGAGSVGRDFLKGKFHGPDHEETYGVFDTGTWVGAFGARRM